MRQKLLLLLAVLFGVLAFILTFHQINKEKRKIQSVAREVVLLQATRDISENETIAEDALRGIKVPRFSSQLNDSKEIPFSQKNLILNRKAQFPIAKGSVVQWTDLQNTVATGRDGLTRLIRPGYRAISISVDQTASVTGLVQPGNYVDLIGTFRFPDMRGDSTLDTITLTILQRVRVIATGTDYGLIQGYRAGARSYSTVTLELSPKEVEMIIFATQKGRIQLSLRNYEDSMMTKDLQSVNWKFLQNNINKYNQEREKNSRRGAY